MEINWLAILVAAIINMVVGTLWYGPFFGKAWRQMTGMSLDPNDYAMVKKAMMKSISLGFVLALIMNFIFAHVITVAELASGRSGAAVGLYTGFFIWVGFMLIATSGVYVWEGKPFKLWAIHASYYLAILLLNGALLAAWM